MPPSPCLIGLWQLNSHSAQDQYIALINASEPVKPAVLNSIFDKLPPIKPNQSNGEWNGGFFDTGHQVASTLKEIRWVGKSFKSTDDVDPVIIEKNVKRMGSEPVGASGGLHLDHGGKDTWRRLFLLLETIESCGWLFYKKS
ncbi:hypothetical protein AO1008_10845 [Aspergillus oryzae 100-8]|uniref:GXWXG domain-containing protein n=1 Tax=Aspergillus oryzae (strain 3.042) TaxID=1160506 RepID=I8TN83_ASPO3|nr:hypothetical protein Ao3042_08183 [Aspergillus oryzae 3.042]KDE84266.1 hypothetical protein AO1008_10845 [Aspergillus oryzae 100-8]|eukprot:EIT75383.1 hypothetical protein Ao3042_08183 [Aspergillus oryzae 3.042]